MIDIDEEKVFLFKNKGEKFLEKMYILNPLI